MTLNAGASPTLVTPKPENSKSNEAGEFEQLLALITPKIVTYLRENQEWRDTKVVEFQTAKNLRLTLADQLKMQDQKPANPLEAVVEGVTSALRWSVRTTHPLFLDKLCAGSEPVGQVAELVAAVLNTNVHTYAVAPFFATLETEVIKTFGRFVGWDADQVDGIVVPGGSYANLIGLVLARHRYFPALRTEGYVATGLSGRPVMLASQHSHYSAQRNAMLTGVGMHNVEPVECDSRGRMCPQALKAKVRELKARGDLPFFVQATAGTTVLGAFDPLEDIAEVCRAEDLWLHVDGSWGGSVLLSEKHRHLMDGVHLADSVGWNPHKAMGIPLQCSVILTRHQGALQNSNNSAADYLFHPHEDSSMDLGNKTLQCGRKTDAFKLWLSWKRHGLEGFRARIDKAFDNAQTLARLIQERPGRFILVKEPEYTNVCFFFVPPSIRNGFTTVSANFDALDQATKTLYSRQQAAGTVLINFNPLKDQGLPRFFRCILISPNLEAEHLVFILDEFERLGADM